MAKRKNSGQCVVARTVRKFTKGLKWFKRGVWWTKIRLNRKHKDRLFRYLFQDKRYLLDLYNALHERT